MSLGAIVMDMKNLMTWHFSKWVKKQDVTVEGLLEALEEVRSGKFEANLGGHLVKKRIRFKGQGKSGSGRVIVCYKQGGIAMFVHGFSKNEKPNLSSQELIAFKEFAKVLVKLSPEALSVAIKNRDFVEVK